MVSYLVPSSWKLTQARLFQSDAGSTPHYLFIGNHTGTANTTAPIDDLWEATTRVYDEMICGKRVANTDVSVMIRRVDYVTNTVYDKYDDADQDILDKDYYAVVNAGSFYHVWKVLENGGNVASTVAPDIGDVDPEDLAYRTSDGYFWKYLYSVSSSTAAKFATSEKFPASSNATVVAAAVRGAIDVIAVDDPGEGYDNYTVGTFSAGEVRVDGNTVLYDLKSNTSANNSADYFNGCILYISAGPGVGQYRRITDYFTNANGKFAVISSEFATPPENTSEFEVYPEAVIFGNGSQTVNAEARAIVNSAGNTVERVEVLSRGLGYQTATATVNAHASVGVANPASIRPIMGPPSGHGSDPALELGATSVAVSVQLSNSEANTIPATGRFQQLGILRDPKFGKVSCQLVGYSNVFMLNENVVKVSTRYLANTVSVNTTSNAVIGNSTARFDLALSAGDLVMIVSSDSGVHQLANVSSVTNSTHFRLAVNANFLNTSSASLFLATPSTEGRVTQLTDANTIQISNISSGLLSGDMIVGRSSTAVAICNSFVRAGDTKDFSTFIQAQKFVGSMSAGSFSLDEAVFQGDSLANSTSNAFVHSTNGNVTFYCTKVRGTFGSITGTVSGANSGAVAAITNVYSGELCFGTGNLVFLENMDPVTRQPSQSERFIVILEF